MMIRSEWLKSILLLDQDIQQILLQSIVDYQEGKEVKIENNIALAVFNLIKVQIDETNKRKENGAKGGRPKISRGSTKTKTTPKTTTPKEEISEKLPNEDIDKCIELVKSFNNGIINDSQKKGRWFANHLINKLSKLDSVISGNYTRYETLEILLKIVSENKFYQNKISSVESIYRNLATLMQVCKGDVKKQTQQIVLTAL